MLKFPSIEQFRNVKRSVEMKAQYVGTDPNTGEILVNRDAVLPDLSFEGTIKLHGTNAAVILNKEGKIVSCQSRERVITPQDDNAGFAKFIHALDPNVLKSIRNYYHNSGDIAVYGEWAGKGVQQGVAISQLDKFFCIFAIREILEDENVEHWLDISNIENDPANRIFNIKKFRTFLININFQNPEEMIKQMNAWTLEVENECPFAKQFGVSGVGEGIVWRCFTKGFENSKFNFKTKGDKHSESKVNKLATVDIEKVKSAELFAEKHVHNGRLEQGYKWLEENKKPQDQKSTGDFIKWVWSDILKEEKDEMEGSGLSEKDVNGAVSKIARNWYFKKINSQN